MKPLAVLSFLLLLGIGEGLSGAALSIANQSINPGGSAITTVSLSSGGQNLSGVQFDLQWDPALDLQIIEGAQLGDAYKILYTSGGSSTLRCLIVGINQTSIADGQLINVFIAAGGSATVGVAQIRIVNAAAVGPAGNLIVLAPASAGIQILSGAGPPLLTAGVLNAASLAPGPISPGEIVTLFGSFPIGSLSVSVNNVPAPLLYASSSQVNAIVPFALDLSGPAAVQVGNSNSAARAPVSVTVAPVAPALFTMNGGGSGPGAVLNQDYSLNSFSNPAARGSVIMLYGSGFGVLTPPPADGQPVIAQSVTAPVTASIGGLPATVLYSGSAPGLIAGVYQINVQIPPALVPGAAVPVVLSIGSQSTQAGFTVSTQ